MSTNQPGNSLRQRAARATGTAAGTDVERQAAPPQATLAGQIQMMQSEFAKAMPRGAEAQQLVRDALTALRTTKNLDVAEPRSVLGSLMTCAQLGLRVGVLGQAWVLPFWDRNLPVPQYNDDGSPKLGADGKQVTRNGGHRAQLIIGYQGLIELAHRSGRVSSLIARTVYAEDEFDVDYGLADRLVHKPNLTVADRGEPVAYYAIVKLTSGGHAFYVMSHREMETYRDRFAMAKKDGVVVGPWRDNFESMALKTVVRQLAKWMPKSTELATAIAVDETVRLDVTPDLPALEAAQHVAIGDQPAEAVQGEVVGNDPDDPTVREGFGTPDGPR